MTEIDIRYDDHGSEARIQRLAVFMTDLRSFWPLLVPLATSWWRRQFETEGEFGGDRWAALSPDYAAAKAIRFPGKKILEATGDMRRAASNPRRAVTPTSMTLTIDDPKLSYHQQEDGPVANLPRRPLVFGEPLPLAAEHELEQITEHYITDLLRRV